MYAGVLSRWYGQWCSRFLFATAIVVAVFIATPASSSSSLNTTGIVDRAYASAVTVAPETFAQGILTRHNQARVAVGLAPLHRSPEADQAALARALDMAANNYLAHRNPQGIGPADVLAQYGVPSRLMGENIGRTNYPPDQVVNVLHAAWMASEHHRDNVLDPRFERVGIGVAVIDNMYYFALIFLD